MRLVLAPHPDLSPAHRRAVELDFGMTRGRVTFECRQALLFYVLRHLRLDGDPGTAAARQIVLANAAEVRSRETRA